MWRRTGRDEVSALSLMLSQGIELMKIGYKKLIEEAEKHIDAINIDEVEALIGDEGTVIVDIRDIREL